jgi:menaquinol-cytochrome c reductase iron-sulfur subunit
VHPPKEFNERPQPASEAESRRDFLKIIGVGTVGVGVLAAGAVPAIGAVVYPLWHETTEGSNQLITVGKPDMFKEGVPTKVDLFADKVDAWNRVLDVKIGSAWVIKEGDKLTAYSTVCPHLGCSIGWDADKSKFFCPCHQAVFSKDGKVESGPPRRGMDELAIERDKAGLVAIRYQCFKQGTAIKEPA